MEELKLQKLLAENTPINLGNLGLDSGFLDMPPKAQIRKIKRNGHYQKERPSCFKGHHEDSEKMTHEREKMFTNPVSAKGLVNKELATQ